MVTAIESLDGAFRAVVIGGDDNPDQYVEIWLWSHEGECYIHVTDAHSVEEVERFVDPATLQVVEQ